MVGNRTEAMDAHALNGAGGPARTISGVGKGSLLAVEIKMKTAEIQEEAR